jgi:glucose/mannose-6-phosphate isomerase
MTLVQLRHDFEHDRLSARVDATAEILDEVFARVLEVHAEGEGRLAQLLDLMYLGSWVSCYIALANDVDPGPIDAIRWLQSKIDPA